MRIIQTLFVFIFMILTTTTVSAQYGNNGYGGNNYGRNGGVNQIGQMGQNRDPEKPREIPVEETVGKIMEKLKPELNLDALQEIAIANVFTESIKRQTAVIKSETSQEQKINELNALNENTNRKVNGFLNEEQKEKYKILNEESKNPKKSRKKRN